MVQCAYCEIIILGTTPVFADVQYSQERLNISCSFNHTLYQSCLVQVIESVTGFYDALYLEGEESESAHHTLTGLQSGTYTILVYGVEAENSFSVADKPDYFTLIRLPATLLQESTTSMENLLLLRTISIIIV